MRKLALLTAALGLAMVLFMTVNASGQWDFILPFRGAKLSALLLVAYAISVSTILFQTITANRILTPYIMGFDALYLLIQTSLVFLFGGLAYATMGANYKFGLEVSIMLLASLLLFSSLLLKAEADLYRMELTGEI